MKDAILSRVTQEQIFQFYFPEAIQVNPRKYYTNPLRIDRKPSCYFTYLNQTLVFIDWAFDPISMDCFSFVQYKYSENNFNDTLTRISKDFNLNVHKITTFLEVKESSNTPVSIPIYPKIKPLAKQEKLPTIIKIVRKNFSDDDLKFWERYHISIDTLITFRVRSVQEAWINDNLYYDKRLAKDPMFAYREQNQFKLYRPYGPKSKKWRNNYTNGTLEGWDQLPDTGNFLIITKSLKDVMVLYELNIPAVAVKSESTYPTENALNLLKDRFTNIIVWFDNDDRGKQLAEKFKTKTNFNTYFLSENLPKDCSDYVEQYGKDSLLNLIQKDFYEQFHIRL